MKGVALRGTAEDRAKGEKVDIVSCSGARSNSQGRRPNPQLIFDDKVHFNDQFPFFSCPQVRGHLSDCRRAGHR